MAEVENKSVAAAVGKAESAEDSIIPENETKASSDGNAKTNQDSSTTAAVAPAAAAAAGTGAGAGTENAKEKDAKKEQVKPSVHKVNFDKDVVYLYQFSRTPLLPSLSPYCLKVETWLRLSGLKYENVDHKIKLRSKKGQLPFIELNGEEIADSAIIIKELSQRFDKDLDASLTSDQRILAHATISMIENHLTWILVWWRCKNPDQMIKGYQVNLQHALGSRIPNGILNFFFKFHYGRKGAKKVKAQGIGVHKPEEIEEFGKQDLKILSELLADKPFFFGDEPTTLDCVVFSVLAQVHFISDDITYTLKSFMTENCPNLVGHVSRMKERCFPDWDDICTKLDLNAHIPKPITETKENKEGADTEKSAEQEKNESEKELEKDEVDEKTEENKEKEAIK